MNSSQIRQKYLKFFEEKGHKIVPSSSLVPENDPTTLFTSSGMQPMVPYLLGEVHPEGKRIVDSQKVLRAQGISDDTSEVGNNRHFTFFEMLGNWSLGDYFKKEQLPWFFEFLTKEIGLDPQKLYVTVFAGDPEMNIPKDEESVGIWKELFKGVGIDAVDIELGTEENGAKVGMQDGRIFYYGVKKNWWSRSGVPENMPEGEPGGPDSEVFYDFELEHNPKYGDFCHPNCDCGRFSEIGNSVFMQYQKQKDGSFKELPQKNVDFGGGMERLTAASQNHPDTYLTDIFWPIIERLMEQLQINYGEDPKISSSLRIIADHTKAATFLIKDGVMPSNKQQGYVLRKLIRRTAIKIHLLKENSMDVLPKLVDPILDIYEGTGYFNKEGDWDVIRTVIEEEVNRFKATLSKGLREIIKIDTIDGKKAFDLYQTYGFPLEITTELFEEKGQKIDKAQFEEEFKKHQELSRTTSAGQFKGGLEDNKEQTTKLHTTNHIMQAALRQILGNHVRQHGSNITAERLRYDFSHDQKLTDKEIKEVEDLVNEQIKKDLKVWFDIEDKDEAIASGALANVGESYPDKAKVYKIGTPSSHPDESTVSGSLFSKELCGGPHVEHTGVLGKFKILKQESLGAGLKRIYATVG